MGAFADYMNAQAAAAPAEEPVEDTSPGQFQQGLRAGLYGTGSSLAALGGNVAEAVGAEGLSKTAYEKARELADQAAANAPRVSSYHQVLDSPDLGTGLRNAYDYGTGLLGQSMPGVVAGVGGALVGGLPGAIAATAPMEIGDVVQRQQADPSLRELDPVERLGRAAVGGGLSAAAQAVVPAGVAGKLAGRAVEGAASRTVGQIVGAGGADVAAQGVAGAGGETVKQLAANPNAALDPEAIKEAGVGGLVAGTAMGGAGVAGELAHKAAASPGKTLSRVSGAVADAVPASVKDAGAGAAKAATDAAGATVDAGRKAVSDPVGTLRGLYDGVKAKAQDFVSRVARGEDVADTGAVKDAADAGADQGAVSTLLGKLDGERVQAVKAWGDDLLTKAGLPPEKRAEVAQAMGNLADKGSQAVIAKAKQGWDATQNLGKVAGDVMSDFAARMAESKAKTVADAAGETKRSDDYSSLHGALVDALLPVLRDTHPGLLEDSAAGSKAMQDAARAARTAVEVYQKSGHVSSDDLFKLVGLFGDRAVETLDRVHSVLGDKSPQDTERLYSALNELRAQRADDDKVLGTMRRSLDPALQETTTMPQLREELAALRAWAQQPDKATAKGQFAHQSVIEEVRQRYGDKADDVLSAIEREAQAKAGQHMLDKDHAATDEHGNEIDKSFEATAPEDVNSREGDARDAHVVDYGPEAGKNADSLALHPGLDHPEHGQAVQAYKRAKAENPDKSVSFVGARELGENHPRVKTAIKKLIDGFVEQGMDAEGATKAARDEVMSMVKGKSGADRPKYGIVQAESGDLIPGTIDKHNLDAVKLVPKGKKAPTSWRDNKAVFTVDTGEKERTAFDARKVVKEMGRQFAGEYTSEDEKSAVHRTGRMFMTGLAALSDHLGKPIDVPDTTVLDNHGTTYGDIKKLGFAPSESKEGGEHKTSAQIGNELTKQRNVIARMEDKLQDRIERLEDRGADVDNDKGVAIMRERLEKLENDAKRTETHKLKTERDERLTADLETHGKSEADPFGNIHEQAGEKVQEIKVDMAGNGRDKTDPTLDAKHRVSDAAVKAMTAKINAIDEATKSAGGKKIVERARELIANLDVLPKTAGLRLASILNEGHSPSTIGGVINELHGNYKAQFKQEYTKAAVPEKAKPKAEAPKAEVKWAPEKIDRAVELEEYGDINTKEDADAFLHGAAKRFAELLKVKDLDEAGKAQLDEYKRLFSNSGMHSNDLGSFYEGTSHEYSDAQVRKAIVKAVPEVAAFVAPKGEVKYSKLAAQLHDDLERPGFGATHDSPIRHEGRFDWRAHEGKGEGHAAFGAGTYLSTDDGVHSSYKRAFTARMPVTIDGHDVGAIRSSLKTGEQAYLTAFENNPGLRESPGQIKKVAIHDVEQNTTTDVHWSAEYASRTAKALGIELSLDRAKGTEALIQAFPDAIRALESAQKKLGEKSGLLDRLTGRDGEKKDLVKMAGDSATFLRGAMDAFGKLSEVKEAIEAIDPKRLDQKKSPTYEVSVDIGKHELLDWNKSMIEQDKTVRAALTGDKAVREAWLAQFGDDASNVHRGLLNATGEDIYNALKVELGSQRAASEHLQELGILGHKYAAASGKNDSHPNYVVYDDSKISTNYVHFDKSAGKSGGKQTLAQRQEVRDYMHSVLGDTVRTVFKNMPHAGEFESRAATEDIVRISAHLGDPMGTAYHESIHGFFKRLMQQGNSKVGQVLERSAMSEFVQRQMREHFKDNPEVLAQLDTPEEAAAYMYQLWAMGKEGFQIAPAAKGFFRTLTDAIRKVLGVWSQGERAEAIMQYFKSGEFKANMDKPDVVAKSLIEAGHNKALDKMHELGKPVLEVAGAFALAGGQRLRATNIRALQELADKIKPAVNAQTRDTGFINESRTKRADFLHRLGTITEKFGGSQDHLDDALKAMQSGTAATSAEGRLLQRAIQGTADKPGLLGEVLKYMQDSGVDTKAIQPRPDYFPRMYDANAITKNMDKFVAVLERHDITTNQARAIAQRIAGSNGAEFNIETEKPGMQFMKQRTLASIPDTELAPFMKKNLFEIMNSYVTQATRRAEWAKRFGDDGSGIAQLLAKAKAQGASDEHLDAAHKYLKAIDGTLGDTLNPTARRIMGNALVYENIRLLPLAIFSSVVDPLGIAVRGGTAGDAWFAFKRGFKDLRHAWTGAFKEDADSKFAESVGAIDHAMLDGTTSGLYTQGMVGDFAKHVNDKFFKYNLMESFNRSMRIGAARAAKDFMTRHADGTASEHSKRWMRELGYEPGEFDAAKIDDKAKMAINRWVDGAVLRPDAADKPIWMSDPHYMLVSHLKQFVYSFQETILKRVMHEYRNGNFKPAMALASYVPVMVAADAMKGMLQGGGSQPSWKQDWDASDYLASGIERAGMLGVGQFALDGPGMLMGPTAQHILQIAEAADGKGSMGHVFAKSLPVVDAFTEAGPTFAE